MSKLTLHGKDNPCPICGSKDQRCKVSEEGLQMCMTVTSKENIPGYEFRGLDKRAKQWGFWVPAENFKAPEERRAWTVNLQRKKLENDARDQDDRRKALSPAKRDELYRKMRNLLTLQDCDRKDLHGRGFTDEQIERIGFRSVEQWQRLPEAMDPRLPGLNAKGTQLNVPEPGYLCPAMDSEGRICGYQIRNRDPQDGRKYYWLTGRTDRNPTGAPPHTSTGELPLGVYYPEGLITRNEIAFVEGIAPKSMLAAIRLGCPVIGAAGGQWSGSPLELKRALRGALRRLSEMEGEPRFVLYPDAGMLDAKHRLVRMRYECLRDVLGFPLEVAWWGQKEYGDGDIDEIVDISSVGRISYEEFTNYSDPDEDELPEALLLEIEVAKYNDLEDEPFNQVLQEIHLQTDFKVGGRRLDRLSAAARRQGQGSGTSLAELGCSMFMEIEERAASDAIIPGIETGFYDLDSITYGGYQDGDLIITAGRPAMGKTSFVLNAAANMAKAGKSVAIISLEMSKEQISYRILSSLVRIESGRLRTGKIAQQEWEELGHATSLMTTLPVHILDADDLGGEPTTEDIAEQLDGMETPPDIVFIDYLQLMGSTLGKGANVANQMGQISRGLKSIAQQRKVPVNVLSQLSRGVESRTNKRPMMSDLRDSGSIEQDADLVQMLYREEYYQEDTPDRGLAEVIIAKHRNGPTGTIKLLFEPQYTLFRNLAREAKKNTETAF